jgi:hypothetical protein
MGLFSIIRSIGLRDWPAACLAGQPAVAYCNQLRIYSNGETSVLLEIREGRLFRTTTGKEDYSSGNAVQGVFTAVLEALRPGMSVVYVGGLDNHYSFQSAPPETDPEAMQASCIHPAGPTGAAFVQAATAIRPDVFNLMAQCASVRVPFAILDEVSAMLGLISQDLPADTSRITLWVLVCDHAVYQVLCAGSQLLGIAETNLRRGDVFDAPHFARLAPGAGELFGLCHPTAATAAVAEVKVLDLTGGTNDSMALPEAAYAEAFPSARFTSHTALPLAEKFEEIADGKAAPLRALTHYPIAVTVDWPGSKPLKVA